MPNPDRVSQWSFGRSARLGEEVALLTRPCLGPDLGVALFCLVLAMGVAYSSLSLEAPPEFLLALATLK